MGGTVLFLVIFSIPLYVVMFCLSLPHTSPVSSHFKTQSEHAQSGWSSWNSKMFMNTDEAAARPAGPRGLRHCEALICIQCKLNMSGSVVSPAWGRGSLRLHEAGDELFENACALVLVITWFAGIWVFCWQTSQLFEPPVPGDDAVWHFVWRASESCFLSEIIT